MKICPGCGRPISIWSRVLRSGVCGACRREAAARRAAQSKTSRRRQKREDRCCEEETATETQVEAETVKEDAPANVDETVFVDGKQVLCPVCGQGRFTKRETLMNTRGAAFMDREWVDNVAETCTCRHCGHVIWFCR